MAAVIDLVKWDGTPNIVAWKFPSDSLSTWTQLIVNESQEAFLVRGGVYEGPFGAGRHTLKTENLPVLRSLIGVPFGGKSPFTAEVWYVNRVTNLDVRWGTPDAIPLQDPKYGIMIPVRAFGQYGIRIVDSKRFLLKLVGTLPGFDVDTLSSYLKGVLITRIKTEIANCIARAGISILEVATQLEALSASLKAALIPELSEYGVALSQFNIHSINVPENDEAVITLRKALAKRAEMGIIGFTYQQERSFNVMETAAGNEGTAGGVMGAGLGFGMGMGMGPAMGQSFANAASDIRPYGAGPNSQDSSAAVHTGPPADWTVRPPAPPPEPAAGPVPAAAPAASGASERLRLLRELAELKQAGVLTDAEFDTEKSRILAT